MNRTKATFVGALLVLALAFAGCGIFTSPQNEQAPTESAPATSTAELGGATEVSSTQEEAPSEPIEQPAPTAPPAQQATYPEYDGSASYVRLNDGVPSFAESDLALTSVWEEYSPLDSLGRVGVASALIGRESMPTSERESISEVTPTGWVQDKYDFVDSGYVYNRAHLIGFQLTGENANERNLMTGTRSMNLTMLDFENRVADYIQTTGNHVLYRVTPNFVGSELVARGVQMEARSIEDGGRGISLNVYVFNVEPGVAIDYATGENYADGTIGSPSAPRSESEAAADYVLNTNSKKIHVPTCDSVAKMSAKNRKDVHDTLSSLEAQGYEPCKNCF